MGLCTNGSATINSTVKPGRVLMHSNDSCGDFGPGSIFLSPDSDQVTSMSSTKHASIVRKRMGSFLHCQDLLARYQESGAISRQ
jgi:hypothetical protein